MLEELIDTFQAQGPDGVLPLYYKYWVHRSVPAGLFLSEFLAALTPWGKSAVSTDVSRSASPGAERDAENI